MPYVVYSGQIRQWQYISLKVYIIETPATEINYDIPCTAFIT